MVLLVFGVMQEERSIPFAVFLSAAALRSSFVVIGMCFRSSVVRISSGESQTELKSERWQGTFSLACRMIVRSFRF